MLTQYLDYLHEEDEKDYSQETGAERRKRYAEIRRREERKKRYDNLRDRENRARELGRREATKDNILYGTLKGSAVVAGGRCCIRCLSII